MLSSSTVLYRALPAVLLCLLLASGVVGQTNLLLNGDFETSILSPGNGWYLPEGAADPGENSTSALRNDGSSAFTSPPDYYSYHGTYALLFESSTLNLSVTQAVAVTGGHQYLLSFFLQFNDADSNYYFQASYRHNTETVDTILTTPASFSRGSAGVASPPMWWSQFTYTINSPSAATSLNITLLGYNADWGHQVDYVTLYDAGVSGYTASVSAPAPPPALTPVPSNNLLLNGDFESGSVAPWRAATDNPYSFAQGGEGAYDFNGYSAHVGVNCTQGSFCYFFSFPYYSLPIWQTVTGISSSNNYTFSFQWATAGGYPSSSQDAGSLLAFSAAWGSNTITRYWSVLNSTTAQSANVTVQLGVPPPYTSTLWIQFDGFSYASYYLIDYTTLTAVASSSSYVPPSTGGSATNLLLNGDFETSILSPGNGWYLPEGAADPGENSTSALRNDGSSAFTSPPDYYSYHGTYALLFESSTLNLSVTQAVAVTGGHQYLLSFFLQFNDADSNYYFQASYRHNTETVDTILTTPASFSRGSAGVASPPMWWSQFTYTINSPSAATSLNITLLGYNADWGHQVDYVTLYDAGVSGYTASVSAPAPPPALTPVPSNNLLLNGDFESGSVAPWRAATDNPYSFAQGGEGAYDFNGYSAHVGVNCTQGSFCYFFSFPYYSLPIWQTVTGISSSNNYTFSFQWATAGGYPSSSQDAGSLLAFSAAWGSNTITRYWSVLNSTTAQSANVTVQLGVPPPYTSTLWIQFDGFSYASYYLIDYTTLTAVASSSSYVPPSTGGSATNLLLNGDFETSILSPGNGWYLPEGAADPGENSTSALRNDGSSAFTSPPDYYSYHGTYALLFESSTLNLSVTQAVAVTGGHQYLLSFFLQFNDADSNYYFQASYRHNTETVDTILTTPASFSRGSAGVASPPMWWSQFTYTINSPSAATSLNITLLGYNADWGHQVDYVTLYDAGVSGYTASVSAPAPPPALTPVPSNNLLLNGDFESGSVAPWRAATDNPYSFAQGGEGAYDFNGYSAHVGVNCTQGSFCYFFSFPYYSLPIWQTVTGISSSNNYTFSFQWATAGGYPSSSQDAGSLLAFSAAWGSNTITRYWSVLNSTTAQSANVTVQLGVPPPYTSTLWIQFDGFSYASYYLIDYTTLTAVASSSSYVPPSTGGSATNLLLNGDFETSILSPGNGWYLPEGAADPGENSTSALRNDGSSAFTSPPDYYSYHGTYALLFESSTLNLSVTQAVAVTGGHQYLLSFFLQFNDADSNYYFQASYRHNTETVDTILTTPASFSRGSAGVASPPMWWSQFTYTINSPSAATSLNITLLGYNADWGHQVDYVTLYDAGVSGYTASVSAPAPPPALTPVPSNNLLLNGDFESGSVAPWRAATDNPYSFAQGGEGAYDFNGYSAHVGVNCTQGSFCYFFSFPYYSLPIWQTVTGISSSNNYTFSFQWATAGGYPSSSQDAGSLLAFSAAWGSNTITRYWSVLNSTTAQSANVTVQLGVPPPYTSTLWIQFDGFSYASYYLIDYTTLTAVASSSSYVPPSTGGSASSGFGGTSAGVFSSSSSSSGSAVTPLQSSSAAAAPSISSSSSPLTSAAGGTTSSSSDAGGLSGGAIAGIVIGSVVGFILLLLVAGAIALASRKGGAYESKQLATAGSTDGSESSRVAQDQVELQTTEHSQVYGA